MPQIRLEQDLQQHLGLESIQGINLLNMNSLELGEYLRDQALSNPFLTIKESEHSLHARSDMRSKHVSDLASPRRALKGADKARCSSVFQYAT